MRVRLADPQVLSRKGLALLLAKEGFEIAGETSEPNEIRKWVIEKSTDVLILSESLLPCITDLNRAGLGILLLCERSDKPSNFRLRGRIYRDSQPEMVAKAIRVVAKGGVWDNPKRSSSESRPLRLTPREQEVARLIARGFNNREVAQNADLSEQSVKNLVSRVLKKMGLRSRVQLALKMQEVFD